jgi:hypothetical protein
MKIYQTEECVVVMQMYVTVPVEASSQFLPLNDSCFQHQTPRRNNIFCYITHFFNIYEMTNLGEAYFTHL